MSTRASQSDSWKEYTEEEKIGIVIGVVVGAFVLAAVITAVVWITIVRKKKARDANRRYWVERESKLKVWHVMEDTKRKPVREEDNVFNSDVIDVHYPGSQLRAGNDGGAIAGVVTPDTQWLPAPFSKQQAPPPVELHAESRSSTDDTTEVRSHLTRPSQLGQQVAVRGTSEHQPVHGESYYTPSYYTTAPPVMVTAAYNTEEGTVEPSGHIVRREEYRHKNYKITATLQEYI